MSERVWNGSKWLRSTVPSLNDILPSAAASTNATIVKASPGLLYEALGYNAAAAVRYLKFYDLATTPDETDTPHLVVPIPATAAFHLKFSPIWFPAGISYRMVTGAADNDTGALTAADVVGLNVIYV